MQINVINGGSTAAAALLYRQPTEQVMSYINAGLNRLMEYGNVLSEGFKTAVNNVYNQYWSDGALEASKWVLNTIGGTQQDIITVVPYETFNNANLLMQRYIIAQPQLNELYQSNMCHGFQDTYFNIEPETFGKERYEYQRVMDGVLQFDTEGEGYINYYSNSDSTELDFVDKLSILDTWDTVSRLLAEGKDPSDPTLAKL